MNQMILGQKIKEARLAKKMTQSEVVGNFITRNMLSQIESGTALPSMRTLAYLAQVLDLSLPALLASAEEEPYASDHSAINPPANTASESFSSEATLITDAHTTAVTDLFTVRRLFTERKLQELLDFTSNLPPEDYLFDEKASYHAHAAFALAAEAEQSDRLTDALTFAKEAEKWADIGFYANPALKADALLLLSRIAGELSKRYSS